MPRSWTRAAARRWRGRRCRRRTAASRSCRRGRRARRSSAELGDRGDQPGPVEVGDLAGVLVGEGGGAAVGLVEEAVGAGGALAVDERLQIPGDALKCGGAHALHDIAPNERRLAGSAIDFLGGAGVLLLARRGTGSATRARPLRLPGHVTRRSPLPLRGARASRSSPRDPGPRLIFGSMGMESRATGNGDGHAPSPLRRPDHVDPRAGGAGAVAAIAPADDGGDLGSKKPEEVLVAAPRRRWARSTASRLAGTDREKAGAVTKISRHVHRVRPGQLSMTQGTATARLITCPRPLRQGQRRLLEGRRRQSRTLASKLSDRWIKVPASRARTRGPARRPRAQAPRVVLGQPSRDVEQQGCQDRRRPQGRRARRRRRPAGDRAGQL